MKDAFFITWVGMSLVFLGLLALWGMMAVLVKLTKSAPAKDKPLISFPEKDFDLECKHKAAAAAVAVVMALIKYFSNFLST